MNVLSHTPVASRIPGAVVINDEQTMIREFEAILAAIRNHNGTVIDDHRLDGQDTRKVYAIGKLGVHTVFLCSPEETPYFCLNGMYVDHDGMAHLSRLSVGGVLQFRHKGSLEAAVAEHNDPANWMPGFKLVPITDVTYL